MNLYCLQSPDKQLLHTTLSEGSSHVWWSGAFEIICAWSVKQPSITQDWRVLYWKKPEAFQRAAKKLGWRAVRVKLEMA